MGESMPENAIEFLTGDEIMTVTFSQKKFVNRIKKLSEEYPDEVKVVAENKDGSILAHVPLSYLKINRNKREYTKADKEKMLEQAMKNFQK